VVIVPARGADEDVISHACGNLFRAMRPICMDQAGMMSGP